MSLKCYQQILGDLVMDPGLRAAMTAGGEAALAGFDLTPTERRRLVAMVADPGPGLKATTVIHRAFRLSMLAYTLPMTCEALGPEGVKEITHAYWREHLPKNFYYVQEALRFARFARDYLAAKGEEHPHLPEVLETETLMLELSSTVWTSVPASLPDDGACAPRLPPGCGVLRFRRDPVAVLTALRAARQPEELPEGEHYLLLTSLGPENVDLRGIDRDFGRALAACPEAPSVRELIERLEPVSGQPVRPVLAALAQAGYLAFERRPSC